LEKYGAGAIAISDYDPAWRDMFAAESARISEALGSLVLAIEHAGSTAVPGLASKPIIDLLVGIADLEHARRHCIKPTKALGYVYIPEYESWLPNELFFRKGPPGPWTHHVHMMEPRCPSWEAWLAFRDYLRAHPKAVHAYANLKRKLATSSRDNIEAYRAGKRAFVEETTAQARRWMAQNAAVTSAYPPAYVTVLPAGCYWQSAYREYQCGSAWYLPSYGANGVYYQSVPAP
jgi:GrpB-like predicted nucleotidyltransferase (UPF0157 family)